MRELFDDGGWTFVTILGFSMLGWTIVGWKWLQLRAERLERACGGCDVGAFEQVLHSTFALGQRGEDERAVGDRLVRRGVGPA